MPKAVKGFGMLKILLLEDDETLGETLKELLERDGFGVTWVKDGESALEESYKNGFDIFLLDVKVPLVDGFELLKGLREAGDKTPAIFITALTDIGSLSEGFESGADDYIKKPFDFDELLVRVHALVKRRYGSMDAKLTYKDIIYDLESETITKDGEKVHLPPYERRLLKLFLQNIGKVVTKEEIFFLSDDFNEASEQAIRVHVNRLRKVGFDIANVRGVGYRLEKL